MNNTQSIEKAKSQLMAAFLRDISPKIYQACLDLVNPLVYDLDLLPAICDHIGKIRERSNENMAFYCAVILRLYSPAHLYIDKCRLPSGHRERFSKQFGFNNKEMWNHWADPVRSHMKNARFASAVNACATDIVRNLKTNGELLENSTKNAPFPHPSEKVEKTANLRAGSLTNLDGKDYR